MAYLVWDKEKMIRAKECAAIMCAQMNPDKAPLRYRQLLEELYPAVRRLAEERALLAKQDIEYFKSKVFYIEV